MQRKIERKKRKRGDVPFPFKDHFPGDLRACIQLSNSEFVLSFQSNNQRI